MEFPQKKKPDSIGASIVANFFKHNAQINKLRIQYVNLLVLKEASEHLKKVENLRLVWLSDDYLNYKGDPIQLNSVKELYCDLGHKDEIPEKTKFDQLETLGLRITFNPSNKWTDFMGKYVNKNLTNLDLNYDTLTAAQLLNIADQSPNLQKVDVSCKSKFTADEIINFLKKSNSMNYFQIEFNMDASEQNHLKTNLPDKWSAEVKTSFYGVIITLKK